MSSLRALWLIIRTSWTTTPRYTLLALAETAGQALAALNPLFFGLFAAGLVSQSWALAVIAVAGFTGSIGLKHCLEVVGGVARFTQMMLVGLAFDERVTHLMGSTPTLDHLEDPEYLDRTQVLRDNSSALAMAANLTFSTLSNLAFAVVSAVVAVTADWRLLILVALGVPRLLAIRTSSRWNAEAERAGAEPSRLTAKLLALLSASNVAAEVRVYGLSSRLRAELDRSIRGWREPEVRNTIRNAVLTTGFATGYFLGAAAVLVWMLSDALHGRVSVRAMVVGLTVVESLQSLSQVILTSARWMGQAIRNAERLLWLEEYAARTTAAHTGSAQPPQQLREGIRLEHVSYRYPGADQDALHDITLDLPAGTVIALVGENGAGKSTAVKLLTGMYDATAGRIRIDGTDLRDMDLAAWRRRTAGAFQDHANFELTAGETVGIGSLPHLRNEPAVRAALDRGTGTAVLTALPSGLDSQLGTSWPDGVELSGGQWQRLAISRGMMRTDPLLLVLDEPTSALDAMTEHELFDSYTRAARESGSHGTVTILVTHRFSTVASADLVVVLHQGCITEIGTHQDLVTAGGRYAELYELQAHGYR